MKTIQLYLLLLIVTGLTSCERVTDLQPDPASAVPRSVLDAVLNAYPTATEIRFSALDNATSNTLWESNFSLKADRMKALVSSSRGLVTAYRQSSGNSLPAPALHYIQTELPGATIQEVSEEKKGQDIIGYKVVLIVPRGQQKIVYFDAAGKVVLPPSDTTTTTKTYAVSQPDLPAAVISYLKTTYPAHTLLKAALVVTETSRYYHLVVQTATQHVDLSISEQGQVLKSQVNALVVNNVVTKELKANELPATITEYLNKTYPGWSFEKGSVQLNNGQPLNYFVYIKATDSFYHLYFDGKGIVGPVKKELKANELPATITEYLNKTYPGWSFQNASVQLKDGQPENYYLYIKATDGFYHLYFDGKGVFGAAKKG